MRYYWIILASMSIAGGSLFAQPALPLWKTVPEAPPMIHADQNGLAPVDGINLYYAVFNKGGKDPVILLHGGFGNSECWGFEVPLLSKTHRVIIADSRGHGRSNMDDQPFSYDLMAKDVLALMDYLKIEKASVVGWSDGGIIGLILAIHHPERVSKLFTYGANFNLSAYLEEPPDSTVSARYMAQAAAAYRRLSPTPDGFDKLKNALRELYAKEPDLKPEDIQTIKARTVIACGEHEQFIRRGHSEALARLIPGARLVVLPNVSHGGPLQDPAGFHQAVATLLAADK
ncbi:MAG TPA: alpha/beta hydrolase [Puia sp.]|nr:alpha/beta hydrolase [Puia sp.]